MIFYAHYNKMNMIYFACICTLISRLSKGNVKVMNYAITDPSEKPFSYITDQRTPSMLILAVNSFGSSWKPAL